MTDFLYGVLGAAFGIAAYIFYIFWRKSSDRIFLFFCLSFCIMAVNQLLFMQFNVRREMYVWVYGARLLAYFMILAGVLDKNRDRILGKK